MPQAIPSDMTATAGIWRPAWEPPPPRWPPGGRWRPRGPNPLIDDPFAEPLVNAVGVDAFIRMMNGEIELAEDDPAFTPQRLSEGMAVRTRFFDSFFLDAAEAGVRQAVILASGLDTRAYRLPWPAGTVVYEIDQPQVIEFKTRTLADLGATPTADRRAVGSRPARRLAGRAARQRIRHRPSRRRGSPKGCWRICRRTPRTACSTTSPRSAPPAAGWVPATSRTSATASKNGAMRSASAGAAWG